MANTLYVIEANPRASRTVPFASKATGVALANAFGGDYDEVDTGEFLKSQGLQDSGSYYSEHRQGIESIRQCQY